MIIADREREHSLRRDLVEYMAAFVKPDVVQKLLSNREREEDEEDNTEIFSQQVADLLGGQPQFRER